VSATALTSAASACDAHVWPASSPSSRGVYSSIGVSPVLLGQSRSACAFSARYSSLKLCGRTWSMSRSTIWKRVSTCSSEPVEPLVCAAGGHSEPSSQRKALRAQRLGRWPEGLAHLRNTHRRCVSLIDTSPPYTRSASVDASSPAATRWVRAVAARRRRVSLEWDASPSIPQPFGGGTDEAADDDQFAWGAQDSERAPEHPELAVVGVRARLDLQRVADRAQTRGR
jgi:hypothetical protein